MAKRGRRAGVTYSLRYDLDDLRRRIQAGQTIADLARAHGVTRQAMFIALSHRNLLDLAREVREAAEAKLQAERESKLRAAHFRGPNGAALAWALGQLRDHGHDVRWIDGKPTVDGAQVRIVNGSPWLDYYRGTAWRRDAWYVMTADDQRTIWRPPHSGRVIYCRRDGDLSRKIVRPYILQDRRLRKTAA